MRRASASRTPCRGARRKPGLTRPLVVRRSRRMTQPRRPVMRNQSSLENASGVERWGIQPTDVELISPNSIVQTANAEVTMQQELSTVKRLRKRRGLRGHFRGQIPGIPGALEEQVRGPGTGTDRGASPDPTAERGLTDLTAEIADKVVGTDPEGHKRGPHLHVPGDMDHLFQAGVSTHQGSLLELVLVTGQGELGQEADNSQRKAKTE